MYEIYLEYDYWFFSDRIQTFGNPKLFFEKNKYLKLSRDLGLSQMDINFINYIKKMIDDEIMIRIRNGTLLQEKIHSLEANNYLGKIN